LVAKFYRGIAFLCFYDKNAYHLRTNHHKIRSSLKITVENHKAELSTIFDRGKYKYVLKFAVPQSYLN